MVDKFRGLPPIEPDPDGSGDAWMWLQRVHDQLESIRRYLNKTVYPQLRKLEEEIDAVPTAPVDSVHGRTGTVVSATSDYDASQIDNDSGVSGATVDLALDALDSGKADTSHTHNASDINAGTLDDARVAESNVTQHEGAVDHDALTNFVAAEHIDWSATGLEDVHADRIGQSSVTQHEGAIDHDALTNFVADEHRTINDAGTGSTDLWSASKINTELGDKIDNINDQTNLGAFPANADEFVLYDASAAAHRAVVFTLLKGHDALEGQTTTASVSAGSTQITVPFIQFTTSGGASDGCVLPDPESGFFAFVRNDTGSNIDVYAATGDSVDGTTHVTLPDGVGRLFTATGTSQWWTV